MSVESIAIALNHSRSRGAAKLVLIGIANHDGDGGAWPSVATLARYAGVIPRNAQKAIDHLESLGEISRLRGQGGNHLTAEHMRPNLYRFLLRCPSDCDRTSQHRTRNSVVLMQELDLSTGVSLATGGVAGDRGRGVAGDTRTVLLTKPPVNEEALVLNRERARAENDGLSAGSHSAANASASLYEQLIHDRCKGRRSGPHIYEPSGYCKWCGQRNPDVINAQTGEAS